MTARGCRAAATPGNGAAREPKPQRGFGGATRAGPNPNRVGSRQTRRAHETPLGFGPVFTPQTQGSRMRGNPGLSSEKPFGLGGFDKPFGLKPSSSGF